MDCKRIAIEVYELAESTDPIAPLVKEALEVIDQSLDSHGCGLNDSRELRVANNMNVQGRSTYLLVSMEEKTVSRYFIREKSKLIDPCLLRSGRRHSALALIRRRSCKTIIAVRSGQTHTRNIYSRCIALPRFRNVHQRICYNIQSRSISLYTPLSKCSFDRECHDTSEINRE